MKVKYEGQNKKHKKHYKFDNEGREVGEIFDKESKVDKVGYVPIDVRIKRMEMAGNILNETRRLQFDFPPNVNMESEMEDIANKFGVEVASVEEARIKVRQSIRESQKNIIKKAKEEENERRKKLIRAEIEKELQKGKGSPPEAPETPPAEPSE